MFAAGCLLAGCFGGSFKPPDELVWLLAGIKLLEVFMCCEAYTGVMQVFGTRLRAVKTPFRI
jgi:quinol-cytochrome oxidoreductase complex cytochrome b subunit